MRQAGVLAAAGLIALEKHTGRLKEDHDNAQFLAQGLARIRGIKVDPATVQTNIVIFDVSGTGTGATEFTRRMSERNVLAGGVNNELVRFVTHMDVDRSGCERALEVITDICKR